MSIAEQIRALSDLDLLADARAVWQEWQPGDASEEWERDALRLRLTRVRGVESAFSDDSWWTTSLDEFAVQALDVARDQRAVGRLGFATLGIPVNIASMRRHTELALELIAEGEERFGMPDYAAMLRARVLVIADQREEARDLLEATLRDSDLDALHHTYADLLYRVGDFDAALTHARAGASTPNLLDALDLETAIHAAQGNVEAAVATLTRSIETSPHSHTTVSRLSYRATLRAELNDLDGARDDFVEASRVAGRVVEQLGGDVERAQEYFGRRLEALAAAQPTSRVVRLAAFPSVVQKWNYCGPAVLELVLRFSGLAMTQDFIAQAVKRDSGTPMHELVTFLNDQGIEARRIEADVESTKAALDHGWPVILEDDYSSGRHVVVAVGYDERLGTLTIADPGAHAPSQRGMEIRDHVARGHRYAGVLVMGPSATVTEAQREAADAAGLISRDYLTTFDSLGRKDLSPHAGFAAPSALEALGIAEATLAAQPDFGVAVGVLAQVTADTLGWRADSSERLARARLAQPLLAEVPIAIASADASARRADLAASNAALATRLDPADATAWEILAHTLRISGAAVDSVRAASIAAALRPEAAGALGLMAQTLAYEVAAREVARHPDRDGLRALVGLQSVPTWQPFDYDDETLRSLALWVTRFASESVNATDGGRWARALVLTSYGEPQAALDVLAEWESDPIGPALTRLLVAEDGRLDVEPPSAEDIATSLGDDPEPWSTSIASLLRQGHLERAVQLARMAERHLSNPGTIATAWLDAVIASSHPSRACEPEVTAFVLRHMGDEDLLWGLADALSHKGLPDVAVAVARAAANVAPTHFAARAVLCTFGERAGLPRDQRIEDLNWIITNEQQVPWAVQERAWAYLPDDPREAIESLRGMTDTVEGLIARWRAASLLGDRPLADGAFHVWTNLLRSQPHLAVSAGAVWRRFGRIDRLPLLQVSSEAPMGDLAQLASWIELKALRGESHDIAAAWPMIQPYLHMETLAAAAARIGGPEHAPLALEAIGHLTHDSRGRSVPHRLAQEAVVRGDAAAAERAAGQDPLVAAWVADGTDDPDVRHRMLAVATERAPHALLTLKARHSAALRESEAESAWALARRIATEFPMDHSTPERLAETEAAFGDAAVAVSHARRAVHQDHACSRAHTALAWSLALTGEWEQASFAAQWALAMDATTNELASLVVAVHEGSRSEAERLGTALRGLSPAGVYDPLVSAALARVALHD